MFSNDLDKANDKLFWKIDEPVPTELSEAVQPFFSTFFPRCVVWCSTDDNTVCLLDGLTAASYTPPSIICAATALPSEFRERLRTTRVCTLSTASVCEPTTTYAKAGKSSNNHTAVAFKHSDLSLTAVKARPEYPSAVASSPIHMFCSLEQFVDLGNGEELLIMFVETFAIDQSVLSPPTEVMRQRPNVTAKIDAELIRPVVSLGNGVFKPLQALKSMPRPYRNDQGGWESPPFAPMTSTLTDDDNYADDWQPPSATAEWSYRKDGGTSPLGYNATTALVMPRPIGWISTYRHTTEKTLHLAPYSFFTVVAHGPQPMVAFSGFRRNGDTPKDAQKDAEETRCYCYNMVVEDLVVNMNLSAAELDRHESEFVLAQLEHDSATLVDAPVVKRSPICYECEYYRTVDVASFSLVIGKVVGVSIANHVIVDGKIDPNQLVAITRLGYMDEYGVTSSEDLEHVQYKS